MRAVRNYERDGRLLPEPPVAGRVGASLLVRLMAAFIAISASLCAQDGGSGIPYSAVFSETGSVIDNPLREQFWSADPQLKVGTNELRVSRLSLGASTDLTTPFQRGTAPTDAMFRFWRLYANFPQTYFELIASDNANQTENDREGGVIAMFASDFDLLIQVTENFQVTASGRFIYLPFRGEFGVEGTGFLGGDAGLSGNVDVGNDLFVEARFDGTLGEWDAFVTDRIGLEGDSSLYSHGTADARLASLAANDFDKADVLGRYRLGGSGRGNDRDDNDSNSDGDDRWEYSVDEYYNRFSAGISRSVPTDTRVGLTVYRNDYWGMDSDNGDQDSEWNQGINLSLINQHYNMRLKPYFSYTVSESSDSDYLTHVARLGMAGPLSEYTDLNANVGYYWHTTAGHSNATSSDGGASDRSVVWHISLHNELNELTTQRLSYSRYVQPDEDQLQTTLTYDLRRTLGPYLESSLFTSWTETDESNDGDDSYDETVYEAGALLAWDVSSRLTLTLTGTVTAVRERDTENGDYEEYTVRLAADYDITDTLSLWLSYEYTRRDDDAPLESYYENLVRMRLTKRW